MKIRKNQVLALVALCSSVTASANKLVITHDVREFIRPDTSNGAAEFNTKCYQIGDELSARFEKVSAALGIDGKLAHLRTQVRIEPYLAPNVPVRSDLNVPTDLLRDRFIYSCESTYETTHPRLAFFEQKTWRKKGMSKEEQDTACSEDLVEVDNRAGVVMSKVVKGTRFLGKRYCHVEFIELVLS